MPQPLIQQGSLTGHHYLDIAVIDGAKLPAPDFGGFLPAQMALRRIR